MQTTKFDKFSVNLWQCWTFSWKIRASHLFCSHKIRVRQIPAVSHAPKYVWAIRFRRLCGR